jgi:hypothetical protein
MRYDEKSVAKKINAIQLSFAACGAFVFCFSRTPTRTREEKKSLINSGTNEKLQ